MIKGIDMNYMKSKKFIEKLKDAKNLLEIQSNNITDEYMQGFYDGMELIVALFESREPIYTGIKPKSSSLLRIARGKDDSIVVLSGDVIKNITNIEIDDIETEKLSGALPSGVKVKMTVFSPEINI